MKVRESGMPEKGVWEGFFNPVQILKTLQLDGNVRDVVEFGCGYGTFTIPAAKIIRGTVYALDIEPEMIEMTKREAVKEGLSNIQTVPRDFVAKGTDLESESVDYVMLFNILHIEKPETLLREAWRILHPRGKLGIIHWNYDASTPRGPSMAIRPKPEQCIELAVSIGFNDSMQYNLKPYHYGIVLKKTNTKLA